MEDLKKTPLYQEHLELNGKMVDFGGWVLPVQYSGILEEVEAVRKRAGIFDVSHMGEIMVRGEGAMDWLNSMVTNDVTRLADGQVMTPSCAIPTAAWWTTFDLPFQRPGISPGGQRRQYRQGLAVAQ